MGILLKSLLVTLGMSGIAVVFVVLMKYFPVVTLLTSLIVIPIVIMWAGIYQYMKLSARYDSKQ